MIRSVHKDDAGALCSIYNHYVKNTRVTFEVQEVAAEVFARRISEISATHPWLVAEREGQIIGYAYASPWRVREAYRLSVETTVYLAPGESGQGTGTLLYLQLLEELRSRGFHTAIGGIALPNNASVKLHEKLGFTKVAHFKEVGYKMDSWVDVSYWQKFLV